MSKPTVLVFPGFWHGPESYTDIVTCLKDLEYPVLEINYTSGRSLAQKSLSAEMQIPESEDGYLIIGHSFGSLLAHYLLDKSPLWNNKIKGCIFVSAISTKGFEQWSVLRIAARHPLHFAWQVLHNDITIPTLKIYKRLFGERCTVEQFRLVTKEGRGLFLELWLRWWPFVVKRFNCPVLFLNGTSDSAVTQKSVNQWKSFYGDAAEYKRIDGAHFDVFKNPRLKELINLWFWKNQLI